MLSDAATTRRASSAIKPFVQRSLQLSVGRRTGGELLCNSPGFAKPVKLSFSVPPGVASNAPPTPQAVPPPVPGALSLRRPATVDLDTIACHHCGCRRSQVKNCARHFTTRGEACCRDPAQHPFKLFGSINYFSRKRGIHYGRCDRVNSSLALEPCSEKRILSTLKSLKRISTRPSSYAV